MCWINGSWIFCLDKSIFDLACAIFRVASLPIIVHNTKDNKNTIVHLCQVVFTSHILLSVESIMRTGTLESAMYREAAGCSWRRMLCGDAGGANVHMAQENRNP
jgi:hypothetical protein